MGAPAVDLIGHFGLDSGLHVIDLRIDIFDIPILGENLTESLVKKGVERFVL